MKGSLVVVIALAVACVPATVSAPPPSPTAEQPGPTNAASPPASAAPSPTSAVTPAPTPVRTATASAAATARPTPTPAAPYCAVADVLTPTIDYADAARTYLDWTYALPASYVPPDLVNATTGARVTIAPRAVEAIGAAEVLARRGDPAYATLLTDDKNAAIRQIAYGELAALRGAALQAGHSLVIMSAYRSFNLQQLTFDYWTGVGGYERALRTSARPGHSEHQLGTALDFGDGIAAPWEYDDWATTAAGAWLASHAADFGFVMSFPQGKTPVTCYDYEPWHYRWVGKALAAQLTRSGLALRELQAQGLR